jgi:hypothetical protein
VAGKFSGKRVEGGDESSEEGVFSVCHCEELGGAAIHYAQLDLWIATPAARDDGKSLRGFFIVGRHGVTGALMQAFA